MNTIYSLLIMFGAFTIGLIFVFPIILLMGAAGFPGAACIEFAKEKGDSNYRKLGISLLAMGWGVVACSYCVFSISYLRNFSSAHPDLALWPLWIAAFYQSCAAPTYILKQNPPPEHEQALNVTVLALIFCFIFTALAPKVMEPLFSWVPYFEANL